MDSCGKKTSVLVLRMCIACVPFSPCYGVFHSELVIFKTKHAAKKVEPCG